MIHAHRPVRTATRGRQQPTGERHIKTQQSTLPDVRRRDAIGVIVLSVYILGAMRTSDPTVQAAHLALSLYHAQRSASAPLGDEASPPIARRRAPQSEFQWRPGRQLAVGHCCSLSHSMLPTSNLPDIVLGAIEKGFRQGGVECDRAQSI